MTWVEYSPFRVSRNLRHFPENKFIIMSCRSHWSLNPGWIRRDRGSRKKTQGAVGAADTFILSGQKQPGVSKDHLNTKVDKSGPWPSGHTGTVLPRSAVSLFTKHKARGRERVGQESLAEALLSVNFSTYRMQIPSLSVICQSTQNAVSVGENEIAFERWMNMMKTCTMHREYPQAYLIQAEHLRILLLAVSIARGIYFCPSSSGVCISGCLFQAFLKLFFWV